MPVSVTAKVNSRFPSEIVSTGGDSHHHLSPLGELDGVADEVEEDLPQPQFVSDNRFRRLIRDREGEVKSLASNFGNNEIDRFGDASL